MTYEQVISIFENTPVLPHKDRRFAFREGMIKLFNLFEESEFVEFGSEEMWYGNIDHVIDKITPELCVYLAERGWGIYKKYRSFSY